MGCYIQVPEPKLKAQQLATLYQAQSIPEPSRFAEIPPDKVLLCVVENPLFDAAAVAYCEEEFHAFKYDQTGRPRTWMLLDRVLAKELVPDLYKNYL